MDFIRRDMSNWQSYRVELNGKFLDWNEVWEASESKGYVRIIVRPAEHDKYGNVIKEAFTKTHYGKVFIVRYYDSADDE